MRTAIMQPYFFPYIGYFQLISAVDLFVVYDNIKYTKKGWINRNRIGRNGQETIISLPLRGASDTLDVRERELASDYQAARLLNQIQGVYAGAPYFKQVMPVIEKALQMPESNLFIYLYRSISTICKYLAIETRIENSSSIPIDHSLKSQDKVLAICEQVGASVYINAIGGVGLYSKEEFLDRQIELKFLQSAPLIYKQFNSEFMPWLSIVDVLMFNSAPEIKLYLDSGYQLI